MGDRDETRYLMEIQKDALREEHAVSTGMKV